MNKNSIPTMLLVIDDDRKLCRLIAEYLEPMGYAVRSVHTGQEGMEEAVRGKYDAVILDVMLPGMDGFEVLKGIRRESDVPVLMLTARGEEADRIVGLEIGADDYLPKTFSTRELLARLRAVQRRTTRTVRGATAPAGAEWRIGELRIDTGSRTAWLRNETLILTPVEFDLLSALARAAGRVKSREQLLEDISHRNYDVFDRSIDVHISSLRKKLNDDPKASRYIRTVRAAGYMMVRPSEWNSGL